jgi:OFA family oxalate/formate antiporter-like MFS transporter
MKTANDLGKDVKPPSASVPSQRGWWMVGAGAGISALVGGSVFYGLGAFFAPIQSQFGLNFAAVSSAFTLQALTMGAFTLGLGWIFDRVSARWLALSGVTLTGVGFGVLGHAGTEKVVYAAFCLMGAGAAAATSLLFNSLITLWFNRSLGLALAVMQTGYGVGALTAPAFSALIQAKGWRDAAMLIGIVTLLIGVPLSLVVAAPRQKKSIGTPTPEGSFDSVKSAAVSEPPGNPLLPAAARSWTFWMIVAVLALSAAVTQVVYTHQIRALESFGVGAVVAGSVAGASGLVGLVGRYGFGILASSISSRYLLSAALLLQGVGAVLLSTAGAKGAQSVVLFVVLFGIGQGGIFLLSPIIQREYFGMRDFGSLQGLILGVGVLFAAGAPLVVGAVVDASGTYRPALASTGGVAVVLAGAVLMLRGVGTGGMALKT